MCLVAAAVFLATVVTSGARMGSLLVFVEAILVVGLCRWRDLISASTFRTMLVTSALVGAVSLAVEGPGVLLERLHEANPLSVRKEISRSTFEMSRQHRVLGNGLGSFPSVYRAYATFDNGYFINHAHND